MFSSAPVTIDSNTADMESAENGSFQNYNNLISFDLMDHTDAGTAYTYAQKITGASTGLAKSIKVYPGDKVKMEGYGKYYNAQSTGTNITAFAGTLLNAFGLPTPAVGEIGTAASAINGWGSFVATGGGNGDDSYPKLFVNILVFDKNYNLLDMAYEQIDGGEQTGAAKLPHDYMSSEYTAKEEGYVFMYFSNESPTQVEFYVDDVTTTYTPTNVVQYNEYYSFGLQTSNSWTRENSSNSYLYNEGSELNSTTGVYETAFRGYDPTLGRFMQVDPLAIYTHSLTEYHYAGNNPILSNDPTGLLKKSPWLDDQENQAAIGVANYMGWATDSGGGGGGGSSYYGSSGDGDFSAFWNSFLSSAFGTMDQSGADKFEASFEGGSSGYINLAYGEYDEGGNFQNIVFKTMRVDQQTQGDPVIFVAFGNTPKNFDKATYMDQLTSKLISNGFASGTKVMEYSMTNKVVAWWNNSPSGIISFTSRYGDMPMDAGGFAKRNNSSSIVIYWGLYGLATTGAGASMADYLNASLHEIGHGFFGFTHDEMGNAIGISASAPSLMDYKIRIFRNWFQCARS